MYIAMVRAFWLGVVLLSTAVVQADERALVAQQLEQLNKDIAQLQALLETVQTEKTAAQKELRQTETQMGTLEQQIRALQEELKKSKTELEHLNTQKKKLQSARLEQQRLIAIQARALYQSGQQEPLRILLSQQQPELLARQLTYYEYIGKARTEQLRIFNETLRQLANVEEAIETQQIALNERHVALLERRAELAKVRAQRRALVARLNKEEAKQGQVLRNRQQEQAEKVALLKVVEDTLARQAQEAELARQELLKKPAIGTVLQKKTTGSSMAAARGSLPWPVQGRLLASFNSPRAGDARVRWDGVFISATESSLVKAIYPGRIVYADWLSGSGLLVILDHGDGYLSLYGHNQSILKKIGESVKAGEGIATVGSSGGQASPGLYFAIRQRGEALNPEQWCRTQG